MSEITLEFEPAHRLDLVTDPESKQGALTAVHVEPCGDGEILLAATDGRALAVIRQIGEATAPHLVPGSAFKRTKAEKSVTIFQNGELVRHSHMKDGIKREALPAAEGRFPRFRSILPDVSSGHTVAVSIDPQVLLDLATALGRNSDNHAVTLFLPVSHQPNGEIELSAIGVAVDGTDGVGAMMPCSPGERKDGHSSHRAKYAEFVASIQPKEEPAAV